MFLSKQAYEKLRKILLKKQALLTGNVAKIQEETFMGSQKERSGEISGMKSHMADSGSDAYGMELMIGLASNQEKVLRAVNAALERMDKGVYGYCTRCGKAIPQPRLEAIPEAELCLKCAESE